MNKIEIWQDAAQIEAAIDIMARDLSGLLQSRGIDNPFMVGIHTGGVWVAERLHRLLKFEEPLGKLDISFYRDDFTRIGINPVVKPSQLPDAVDDHHIVLVDDVLQTGRTIRAALNELFDYGRPASVMLAVLLQRRGRELPIEPDVTGLPEEPDAGRHVKLTGPDPLKLVMDRARPTPEEEEA